MLVYLTLNSPVLVSFYAPEQRERERHCKRKVPVAQEHNTATSTRAGLRTALTGVQYIHTTLTVPPTMNYMIVSIVT